VSLTENLLVCASTSVRHNNLVLSTLVPLQQGKGMNLSGASESLVAAATLDRLVHSTGWCCSEESYFWKEGRNNKNQDLRMRIK
jgi:hypothetical protein